MNTTKRQSPFIVGQASGLPQQGVAPVSESTGAEPLGAAVADPAVPEPPAVRLRRLAGVASWALLLVLAGVASAIVSLFQIFGDAPSWFTPAFITVGVIGMLLTMMAFATLRFRGVPWMFMAAASATLLAAFALLRLA
ncbi:hypothetical protein [Glycomyces buryatensis]|uniref:Uncharacterized protein n=1 Tax=Glycomyces buryatensis TaxID=2570927 RepID=A0A4S8QR55_9ACTN|nr:hypothetical protein [Glycomyces buryatensis]THV43144.1 hypothetical protein FAB82_02630 [Glycomyces buryatensis]